MSQSYYLVFCYFFRVRNISSICLQSSFHYVEYAIECVSFFWTGPCKVQQNLRIHVEVKVNSNDDGQLFSQMVAKRFSFGLQTKNGSKNKNAGRSRTAYPCVALKGKFASGSLTYLLGRTQVKTALQGSLTFVA